jgi:hypothetical protein
MKVENKPSSMTEGRALLTEREREALADDESGSYRYKTRTYLRNRLDRLERDAELLREHEPDLYERLQAAVSVEDPPPKGSPSQEEEPLQAPTHGSRDDDLMETVDQVAESESWSDSDPRLKARKRAALAVLQYARDHGGVSQQEAKEKIYPEYPVENQSKRTWYRKNIRPVLKQAAEYDEGAKRHRLTDSDT